jgi:Flp pilus assembly protein TadD
MQSESEGNRRQLQFALGASAIVLLTFIVYWPVLPGSFVLDDAWWVGDSNPLITGKLTPWNLWFRFDFTLAAFGWWLEHLAFGANPAGYHVINIALQAISALLLWRLLAQLKIRGAWLAAALFAVHPVCVNSVARISELKNTLSLPFFLLSFISYLHYESKRLYPAEDYQEQSSSNATQWYAASLIAFVLALLAKTTAVVLPVLLLLCALWQRKRIVWKDVLHTLPFFALSLAFGLMSMWYQKNQALQTTLLKLLPTTFPERLAGAGYCFWFYLSKALFPFKLCLQYPRWTIDTHTVASWLPDIFAVVLFILCVGFWRSWGRHALFALGCFAVMLFPALGFFDAQYLTLWQVSDHLQYPALAAIIALVAAALAALPSKRAFRVVAVALILGSSIICFQRAGAFSTPEKLYMDTIAKNPMDADAYNQLGIISAEKRNYSAAMTDFALAVKADSDNCDARMDLGHVLALEGKFADAETQYVASLKIRPSAPQAQKLYAELLQRERRNAEALYHLRMAAIFEPDIETFVELASLEYAMGNPHEAVAHLQRALALKSGTDDPMAFNNLAWILATCGDASVRNGNEAVQDAERACELTGYKQSGMMGTLAAAYAEAGRFPEAIATAEKAANLATQAGNTQFAAANQQLLFLYRAGKPYHEPPPNIRGQ